MTIRIQSVTVRMRPIARGTSCPECNALDNEGGGRGRRVAMNVITKTWRGMTAGCAAVVMALTFASPADASAVGYAKVDKFCYEAGGHNLCLPTTTLGHFIRGSGRTITREEASVQDTFGGDTAGGKWCNWRIDWRYADTAGRTYRIVKGPMHHSCGGLTSIGRVDKRKKTLKHYGKACAAFYAGNQVRAVQCHNIVK
ncbi:hypothetical protein SRB5_59780 [Streptomyces sp. RB5]|uniref:Uncharacterized protein n=1 Tax=Streptomyces smaragdinus TaxID=2585196 RepID=A0A7K0CQM8_9ACTN|nr:hypothetical protein [Streptomyces smaragdinus]MQY15787.1 hypothetical protein [Streptomyces smaragdinus]